MFDLTGRVAVITGASRGIGRAIALECAKMGATVVVSSRKIEACEAVVAEIRDAGGKASAWPAMSAISPISKGSWPTRSMNTAASTS